MKPGIWVSMRHLVSPEHSLSLAQSRVSPLEQALLHDAPVSLVVENDAQQLI
jgi:hypothetical protein